MSEGWAKGGEGALEAADAVLKALESPTEMKFLYPEDTPIKDKIETIAKTIFGAGSVSYSAAANRSIKLYTELGFNKLSINMAKTHLSLSHDPKLIGVPRGFTLPIREVRASVGAGFLYPICGSMMTMPGLGSKPAFMGVDIDKETGKTVGLF